MINNTLKQPHPGATTSHTIWLADGPQNGAGSPRSTDTKNETSKMAEFNGAGKKQSNLKSGSQQAKAVQVCAYVWQQRATSYNREVVNVAVTTLG